MRFNLSLSLLVLSSLFLHAQAASFDCNKSVTDVENMVCADAALGRLDEELMRAYTLSRSRLPAEQQDDLRAEQRLWLRERGERCESVAPCRAVYEERIVAILDDVSNGASVTAVDFYERFNMRSVFSSYNQRLRYYCESYPQAFFPQPDYRSPEVLLLTAGDDVWEISVGEMNTVTISERVTSGSYNATSVHRLYFDEGAGEWRSLETYVDVADDCQPYKE